MENLQIIKSIYASESAEAHSANLKKYLSEDIVWIEAKGFPYAGSYTSFEAIIENVFSKLATEWIDYCFVPEDYLVGENKVAAYGTYYGTYKTSQKTFKARVMHLWKFKGGNINYFEQIVDSKTVVDAMS